MIWILGLPAGGANRPLDSLISRVIYSGRFEPIPESP